MADPTPPKETIRQLRCKSYTPDPLAPPLQAQWFHAIDAPLVDPMELRRSNTVSSITPTTPAKKPTPAPKDWVPFSKRDSSAIEQAYQEDIQDAMVPVNEDHLFEVNVQKRTIEPIYWEGPTHQVRRATWFIQGDGKWFPCQENLAEQIETGYHKYKPYEAPAPTQESATTSTSSVKSESHEESKLQSALEQQPVEKQWNLLGAYLEQYVVYTGPDTAWLLYDTAGSKIAQTIITKLTNNQNLGGTRLLRGYDQVKKLEGEPKKPNTPSTTTSTASSAKIKLSATPSPTEPDDEQSREDTKLTEQLKQDYENEESEGDIRPITHLIFAIHGIGQKFSERMGSNFVHDVNTLRKTMKACHEAVTDDDNGIQVLPILWRKSIAFGMASDQAETDMGTHDGLEDGCPTLEEITLDGAPMYRTIVSDVFLDIPLYMTQKYRDQMAGIITKEINRVYQLFLDRHPDFLNNSGKVSILGHSLGSLLAFDILSTQPFTDQEAATLKETQQAAMAAQSADHKHAPALQFPVDNFFAVGSPLGVLLLLRGFKIMSRQVLAKDAKMHWDKSSASLLDQQHVSYYYPAVNNLYNIFHRSDPVAYRLEPLISRHYGAKEKPVPIPYIKGGLKGVLDASFNVGSGLAKTAGAMFDNFKLSWTNNFMRAFATKAEANEQERAVAPVELRSISAESKDYGESKLAMLNARQGRVDYCLQEGILENAYFSALSVHMNYWTDLDVAAMLIREICPSHKPQ